ncbi:MAG: hypothetical protein ACRDWH_03160 [Acidimicrobiia bacterium]
MQAPQGPPAVAVGGKRTSVVMVFVALVVVFGALAWAALEVFAETIDQMVALSAGSAVLGGGLAVFPDRNVQGRAPALSPRRFHSAVPGVGPIDGQDGGVFRGE